MVSLEAITYLRAAGGAAVRSSPGPPRRVLCVVGWKAVSREADGAKRSGLTEPWTAEQSRVVMTVVHAAVLHVSNSHSDRGARVEGEAGGAAVEAAAVQIQSRCALAIKNARSRRNLTARWAHGAASGSRGALPGPRQRRCAVQPDERDMQVGRERPPQGRAQGEEGGSHVGVAHAPPAADGDADTGTDETRAAQSAAR